MTAPARFLQADVTRAVKGAREGGLSIGRVEVEPNGKIVILVAGAGDPPPAANEWDEELQAR